MALARLTFDQASELIAKWYYGMRVDFLEVDELDWELESRSITIDENLSLSQKRKWLRDSLKHEQQRSVISLTGIYKGEVKQEIKTCIQKFNDLKKTWETASSEDDKNIYVARLLHLGARIVVVLTSAKDSPNLHSNLQNVLVELVSILEPECNKLVQNESINELANTEGNENRVNRTEVNETGQNEPVRTPTPRMTVLSQEDLDWIHSLQARIVDLEYELQRKKGKEVGTQTSFEKASLQEPPRFNYYNPNHNFNPFPWSHIHPQFPIPSVDHVNQPHRTVSIETSLNNSHNNPPINTTFPISSHHSNPNIPVIGTVPNPPPQSTQTSQQPIHHPSQNQSQYPQFPNPYPNQYSVPYQTRHTLPVSKWNIAKYSGDDQGLKLN